MICKRKILAVLFFISFIFGLKAQNQKVVGFLPHYRFNYTDDIDFSAITHLNLAFANPDMDGNLSFQNAPLAYTINKAKEHDVQVFISLAGGYLLAEWDAAWQHLMKEENRSEFIHKIVEYVKDNNADGVDIDLEWQYVTDLYSPFANELIDSLHAHELTCTASLPGTYRYPEISDETLGKLDWINMMVYDLTGPWDPGNPGPHSPFSFAENSLFYWNIQGVENERLTLGMPFYGYDFTDPTSVSALTYRYIVQMDEENANYDQIGEIYYNGIPTIQAKTQLAIDEELAGVMIWELGQDNYEEHSLLAAINETLQSTVNPIDYESQDDFHVKAYPNPFSAELQISLNSDARIQLYSQQGELVTELTCESADCSINTAELFNGLYILRVISETEVKTISVLKQ